MAKILDAHGFTKEAAVVRKRENVGDPMPLPQPEHKAFGAPMPPPRPGSNPERKCSQEQSGSSAKRTQPGKWSLADRCLFMSHSSKDKDTVDEIVQALRQSGINVWYDKDEIRTGHQWDKKISEVMPHMYGFICCMSEEFFDSDICYEELQAFRSARKDNSAIPKDSIFPVIVVDPSLFKGVRASWRMALPTQTHYKRWTVDNDQQLFLKDMKDFVNGSTPTPSQLQIHL
jgi:hypothetical protein